MFNLIVIDDEINICNLIENLIDYEKTDMKMLAKFTDSVAALQYIKDNEIDVVISDIQMQSMTGLELLGEIRKIKPEIHFIIISGFNYFDFAKQAIQYGADNYLLKPINRNELNNALISVGEKIRSKRGIADEIHKSREQIKAQSIELFSNDYFRDFGITRNSIDTVRREYGLELQGKRFVIGILHIDTAATKYFTDPLLFSKAIERLRRERSIENCLICNYKIDNSNQAMLFNVDEDKYDELMSSLRVGLSQLQEMYGGDQSIFFTLSLSERFRWEDDHVHAYNQACAGIKSRLFFLKKQVVTVEFTEYGNSLKETLTNKDSFRQEAARLIETLDIANLEELCNEIFVEICNGSSPVYQKMDMVWNLLGVLVEQITKASGKRIVYDDQEFDGMRSNFRSLKEYYTVFKNRISNIVNVLNTDSDKTDKWAVATAKNYIQEHYAEKITADSIAETVHLAPTYIGTLFKKEAGETISEYLTNVRLGKAKELLKDGSYNVSEIADMVGYPDAKYFSKLFKKEIGVKPTDYRSIQAKLSGTK